MKVLGIETSCDECSVAIVENGSSILANHVATQIKLHEPFYGVVPEIASRLHTEWIVPTYEAAMSESGCSLDDIDGIAVTVQPGLLGSLLVGLSFAKGLSFASKKPLVGVDHIMAHLYAPHLAYNDLSYPYLGLLLSGGHSLICKVNDFDKIEVMGTTIDDACGEAFDKVAKYYDLGYPGGIAIDKLAKHGNAKAFNFPKANLHKGEHRYDVSYSGLKTAVINQLDQFWNSDCEKSHENIAASFQKTAIDTILKKLRLAINDTGISTVLVGGGVAANSYLRSETKKWTDVDLRFPPLALCTDNAAMIAGIAYHYFLKKEHAAYSLTAKARVRDFKRKYP